MSIWGVHMDALRQRYPGRVQLLETSIDDDANSPPSTPSTADDKNKIVQKLRVLDPSGWDLTLHLPQGFPEEPPLVIFSGYKVPYRWGSDSLLPEAVDLAVSTLSKLTGSCGPISLNQLANSVAELPQCEAAMNANALKAIIDESPIGQSLQKELDALWQLIEKTAQGNLEKQPQIEQLQHQVATRQVQVKNGLSGLGNRRKEVLDVLPLGSYEGLIRAGREELHHLEEAAAQICKAVGSAGRGGGAGGKQSSSAIQAHLSMMSNAGTPGASTASTLDLHLPITTTTSSSGTGTATREAADTDASPQPGDASSTNEQEQQQSTPITATHQQQPGSPAGAISATSPVSNLSLGANFLDPLYDAHRNNNKNSSDDDDEEGDEMERLVEKALKVCIEARRAALLLKRFQAPQGGGGGGGNS